MKRTRFPMSFAGLVFLLSACSVPAGETARESVPITVFFDPQVTGVQAAEVFTNLNRRDWATTSLNGDGVEEGISPPPGAGIAAGDDRHYYKAYPMSLVPGGYQLTLPITKTGAYRLTARYRLTSDPPGTYRWYGSEQNAQGIFKRDHAIVVSPGYTAPAHLRWGSKILQQPTHTGNNDAGKCSGDRN